MAVVEVERTQGVSRITLNRPDVRNALNEEVRDLLQAELQSLADDPSITVVVLRGRGRSFCARQASLSRQDSARAGTGRFAGTRPADGADCSISSSNSAGHRRRGAFARHRRRGPCSPRLVTSGSAAMISACRSLNSPSGCRLPGRASPDWFGKSVCRLLATSCSRAAR